jgi:hypothetical protein
MDQGTSGLNACRFYMGKRLTAYHWVTSAAELRNTLLTLGPVCVGVDWYNSMFSPKVSYGTGRAYMKVDKGSGLAGGHEFIINGINLKPVTGPAYYRMKNSWGKSWPGSENPGVKTYGPGTARFALADLESLLFNDGGDAVLITEVAAA